MLNFSGGNVSLGTSVSPLGMYAGYLLFQSGNIWLGIGFLLLTTAYMVILLATLCRYAINYYRNRHLLRLRG